MLLRPHEAFQRIFILGPDLVLVALHKREQRLVPHGRHLPLVSGKAREVIYQGIHLWQSVIKPH